MLKKTTTTIKQVMMNLNTNGVNFELIVGNNRSESAAKNDIFIGTANYITSILFHFNDAWSFRRKAFMYSAKQSTHSQVITLFEKFLA